jgi:hypothetical protein
MKYVLLLSKLLALNLLIVDGTCLDAKAALGKLKGLNHHMNVVKVTKPLILYSG